MLRRSGESPIAEAASERFVSRVNPFMLLQISVLTEALAAMLTFKGLVS